MSRKELLDARKSLRSVREALSGPRSRKQRGKWEKVSIKEDAPQQHMMLCRESLKRQVIN